MKAVQYCDKTIPYFNFLLTSFNFLPNWLLATDKRSYAAHASIIDSQFSHYFAVPSGQVDSNKHCMARNIGGESILAYWQLWEQSSILHPPKNFTVWCHRYCKIIAFMRTRPAARRASLIVGVEFTIESCVQRHHFSKRRWEKRWLSVNTRTVMQTMCTHSLLRLIQQKQSKLSVTTICLLFSCISLSISS